MQAPSPPWGQSAAYVWHRVSTIPLAKFGENPCPILDPMKSTFYAPRAKLRVPAFHKRADTFTNGLDA
jgi:hypothetical protein